MTQDEERVDRLARLLEEGHGALDAALEVADGLVHDGELPRRTLDDLSDAITLLESAVRRVPSDP